ncbi:MAG TPA: ribbon-helix-helix protein, CopG family [Rhodospirillaceae bacterium]|nr:ribbon-helix-helix protein, CopG family [Rhodospirillaceae bacterium]
MRRLVDINDAQIRALDELSQSQRRSRAALIRNAIDDFIAKHRQNKAASAFGLWGEQKVDGLAYQERVRGEW